MPITLDTSLPPSLYPLAWLVGSWEGIGALHDGDDASVRIEQQLTCTPQEDGTLAWSCRTYRVDAPAPLPPDSAFARSHSPAGGTGERSLLHRESGVLRVGDLLPGQDEQAARAAKPGSADSQLSYALSAQLQRSGESSDSSTVAAEEIWQGEARGPRIQLALGERGAIAGTRMIGYISGRLMWLWERPGADGELAPYLSVELDRA